MNNLKRYIESITEFSEQNWSILSDCVSEMQFKKNEPLLKEGQICNSIYFISSGVCKSCYNMDGKEINTAFYFENDFATNIKSLRTSSKSEYNIKAHEKTKAVKIDKTRLLEAYKQSHQIESFGRKVLELITAKYEEHSDGFKLLTPKQRFDALVSQYPDFLQRISLTQTASYLGISRETLSRFRAIK
ncbi:Crp/Fnr family transcriptional regulator [Panacibacter ginsenosidivorans]|uniref:Crp/Fnr family transcriptional regulator n=1 Tax=Panacibacter ginsenosidivorans TaxID=1813871 RepID=A0A5B8VER2_9BACT|nr:Crp/Fnr family transcriptional regulator [Panacibacter ginsenosidivorans]QEC69543.1 Crp/Fnr family transcriptional regulator [Panacibacter ginsenosidivorans]